MQEEQITQETQEKKTDDEMIQEYLIANDREETELTIKFAKQIIALDLEIKVIRDDQKELKKQAKDEGVSVQKVTKAINQIKAFMKTNDADLSEIENIELVLNHDVDVRTQLAELVRKS